jgi:predicted nucleic acid-binding protein
MKRYLLDTNMLLGFTRRAPWALWAYQQFDLGGRENMVFTSVICKGELLALAEKRGWGGDKRTNLQNVLNQFPTVDINKDRILDAYAMIDVWTHGKVVSDKTFPSPPKPAVSMKQNDLWIAATARASKAILLTTDKDFDHLDGICLERYFVDQSNKPE